jgi:hypothetical protein
MIHLTKHQRNFLKTVAELFPRGTKNEYWGLVLQQLEDGRPPTTPPLLLPQSFSTLIHSCAPRDQPEGKMSSNARYRTLHWIRVGLWPLPVLTLFRVWSRASESNAPLGRAGCCR